MADAASSVVDYLKGKDRLHMPVCRAAAALIGGVTFYDSAADVVDHRFPEVELCREIACRLRLHAGALTL